MLKKITCFILISEETHLTNLACRENLKAGNVRYTILVLEDLNLWQSNTEFVRSTKRKCCLNAVNPFIFSASVKLRLTRTLKI